MKASKPLNRAALRSHKLPPVVAGEVPALLPR